jgi:hypothetical protein
MPATAINSHYGANAVKRNLQTVAQLKAAREYLSNGQIRFLIFKAADNGLDAHKAILRIGRRVYIDPDAFDRWIDAQQGKAA